MSNKTPSPLMDIDSPLVEGDSDDEILIPYLPPGKPTKSLGDTEQDITPVTRTTSAQSDDDKWGSLVSLESGRQDKPEMRKEESHLPVAMVTGRQRPEEQLLSMSLPITIPNRPGGFKEDRVVREQSLPSASPENPSSWKGFWNMVQGKRDEGAGSQVSHQMSYGSNQGKSPKSCLRLQVSAGSGELSKGHRPAHRSVSVSPSLSTPGSGSVSFQDPSSVKVLLGKGKLGKGNVSSQDKSRTVNPNTPSCESHPSQPSEPGSLESPGQHGQWPSKDKLPKRHHTRSESAREGTSFKTLFGSVLWKSGSILSQQFRASSTRINVVAEAQGVLPSLASAFSIERLPADPWSGLALDSLAANKSASLEQNLNQVETLDRLEDPAYLDSIQSTDSAGSWLRRSLSVPSKYHYHSQKPRKHAKDIFADIQPEDFSVGGVVVGTDSERQWRQTMEDLLESPEYLDSLQSQSSTTGLLARTARMLSVKDLAGPPILEEPDAVPNTLTKKQLQAIYMKNLFVLSLSFMFIFLAYLSLRNLQSSMYVEGGLGLTALSSVYASLFIGCIFTTTIVQRLRPKTTMLLCMGGFMLYVLANFYPTFYTLVPACMLVGFSLSNLWTSHATYLTNISARYAELTSQKVPIVLSTFNGIFFVFFQSSQIIGGLVSSVVLSPGNADVDVSPVTGNSSFTVDHGNHGDVVAETALCPQTCGAGYCHASSHVTVNISGNSSVLLSASPVDDDLRMILTGVYTACVATGILIMGLFLDKLDGIMVKPHRSLGKQLISVFVFFKDWRAICLTGLMFYSLLEVSFMFGEFTKVSTYTCAKTCMKWVCVHLLFLPHVPS